MAKRKTTPADETAKVDDFVAPSAPEEPEEVAAAEPPIEELAAEVEIAAAEPEPAPEPPEPKEKPEKAAAPPAPPPLPRPQPGDVVQVRLVGAPQAILITAEGKQVTVLNGELHRARYAHYRMAWQANRTAWQVKYPGAAAFLIEAD